MHGREEKVFTEMSVKVGVHSNVLQNLDLVTPVRSLEMRIRKYAPYIAAFILIAASLLFAVSCSGSTVAFSNNSTVHTLEIEVAKTEAERSRGLMGRENLPENSGMLFDFGEETNASFYMKDTSIPLSIAFIDSNGKILSIEEMEPYSLSPVESPGKYRYAIETNQGWFASHDIQPGFHASIDL